MKLLIPEHSRLCDRLEEEQLRSLLRKAMVLLELKHQRVVRMHGFEGKTYKQIAAELRQPEGTMKTHFHFSKNALKNIVADLLGDLGMTWDEAREVASSFA